MANAPVKSDARLVSLPLFYALVLGLLSLSQQVEWEVEQELPGNARAGEAERHLKAFSIVVAATAAAVVVKLFDLVCVAVPEGGWAKKLLRLLERLLIVDTSRARTTTTTAT